MTIILNIIILLFILGILINVHELGHFIAAKKAGVHIYEFAFGMGPQLWKKKGKDGIIYAIRAFPIGGFVSMAGEVYADDDKIDSKKLMCNKSWGRRVSVIIAGVINNFILAILLFFISSLIWGHSEQKPVIGSVLDNYPAKEVGFSAGDTVISVNGKSTESWDMFIMYLNMKTKDNVFEIKVKKTNGSIETYKITPKKEVNEEDKSESYVFGFGASTKTYKGFGASIKYAFFKFATSIHSMWVVIISLFTGALSLGALSGPVGIYQVVGESAKYGLETIMYLTALLSINLGFINILPIPAFDGGRVLFMIIEKIRKKPINQKIENTIHSVFFYLLMLLMLIITFNDIIRLF